MPTIAFGTWRLSVDKAGDAVFEALRAGYRHLDCAMVYRNEHAVGEGLTRAMRSEADGGLGLERSDVWVTGKIWHTMTATDESVEAACRRSASDLGVERLDLVLLHHACIDTVPEAGKDELPPPEHMADITRYDWYAKAVRLRPIHAKWASMERLVDLGLARCIGVSNCPVAALSNLIAGARLPCAANQMELHVAHAQPRLRAFCDSAGVVVQAYSPLGCAAPLATEVSRNRLGAALEAVGSAVTVDEALASAGLDRSGGSSPTSALWEAPVVKGIAARHGRSPPYVLYRWAAQCGACVLQRSSGADHIRENAGLLEGPPLDDVDMALLATLDTKSRLFDAGAQWGLPYFD